MLVVAYNLLTQSWCGIWSDGCRRVSVCGLILGSYSKMIFGESTYGRDMQRGAMDG